MKRILCTAILTVLFGLPALPQAGHVHKRTLEHPGFITSNTSEIEISRIVLSNEQTQVDAVLYGKPGTPAVISADTYLVSEKSRFRLREAEHISIDGMTEPESIPESGKMNITLSFAPIPRGTHEVDFVERESGWNIYGIQLSRKEPYVYVPNFLLSSPAGETPELPEPGLFSGKAIINGYILGYDPRLELDMQLSYKDMLFPKPWTDGITVRQDGSFHAEIDMIQPDTVHLSVNQAALTLFLVPGEEMTAYINLPRLSVSAVRLNREKTKAYRRHGSTEPLKSSIRNWPRPEHRGHLTHTA